MCASLRRSQVTAVIFVAAISEFDQVLYEDEKENRLHEVGLIEMVASESNCQAIRVFDNICNNKYFASTAMILFMNKVSFLRVVVLMAHQFVACEQQDLFKEKIQRVSLRVCFPEYRGADVFDEASEYIKARFLEVNRQEKMVFAHLTCATDTNNVERVSVCFRVLFISRQVFEACKLVILKGNLEKLGLGECSSPCAMHSFPA